MVQQTQDQWLDSKYYATSYDGGLPKVDFEKIADSFGFVSLKISRNSEVEPCIKRVFETEKPVLCNVEIESKHRVIPQVKYGRPNEDSEPLLPRDEFLENMFIEPLDNPELSKQVPPGDSDPFSGT